LQTLVRKYLPKATWFLPRATKRAGFVARSCPKFSKTSFGYTSYIKTVLKTQPTLKNDRQGPGC
jgi:hypothetical protein